jgi:hypothetical protein
MASGGCLVIDDVDASLSHLTELGRNVAGASAEAIRNAVLDYAVRRKWFVLQHQAYVEWAIDVIRREEHSWLVLDPLFPVAGLGERVRRVRLTRQFDNNEAIVVRHYVLSAGVEPLDMSCISGDVGVLDDAAASGGTLRNMARLVAQTGGRVSRVILAASSRSAHEFFRASGSVTTWTEFVRGDWQIVHLRDGCPHLPHSGRPTDQPSVHGTDGNAVEVRVPSSAVLGNLWQVLVMDAAVRNAVDIARAEIAHRLSNELGRAALVGDLSFLGASVPALVCQGAIVTADTTLESLLPSSTTR